MLLSRKRRITFQHLLLPGLGIAELAPACNMSVEMEGSPPNWIYFLVHAIFVALKLWI